MLRLLCLMLLAGILAGGCATNRGEIDLRVAPADNPASGIAVKITEVSDRRVFEVGPRQPSTPSLMNNEINDRTVTARAIARKRNTYGQALGDILLPPGRTVSQLTSEALTKALRESGYRVLEPTDSGYDTARPLQADVVRFWGWFTPGFAQINLEFEAVVQLRGNWPVAGGAMELRGTARLARTMAATEQWTELFNTGIANLVESAKASLQRLVSELTGSD